MKNKSTGHALYSIPSKKIFCEKSSVQKAVKKGQKAGMKAQPLKKLPAFARVRNEFFTFSVFNIRNTFGIMVAMVLGFTDSYPEKLGPFSDGKGFNLWYLTKKI